ncbi:hypothetical protein BDW02DRAFT_585649 [Decorospora gaudefroyi]|uniref:Uncharacterized protein n=1 Tax=Decorospora gaudefroyi TaxID=184978 RepID=A0A6A5KYI9_9PLEO|nr:hypothetical protein BDW02DRAFT_585649 [Decorospora gaudefroyi]
MSEVELTQRQINDRRLVQAINYLAEDGGDDSPGTFINRVNRIDDALLKQLPQQGRDFDARLYRRARAMVREVKHEYEEAVQEASSPVLESEESEAELPQYYTSSAAQALYRLEDDVQYPKLRLEDDVQNPKLPGSQSKGRGKDGKENVESERQFKYGGPNNEVEQWHKNFPAILPFPETIQLAHWESLKIDFDLSESGKRAKANGEVVETNVSFEHPALQRYKNLSQYDSGSRFKLPLARKEVQDRISRLSNERSLRTAVDAFNHYMPVEGEKNRYAPHIFLDTFSVGTQDPYVPLDSLTEIRRAIATTPTKPREAGTGGKVRTGSSNPGTNTAATGPRSPIDSVRGTRISPEPKSPTQPPIKPTSVRKRETAISLARAEAKRLEAQEALIAKKRTHKAAEIKALEAALANPKTPTSSSVVKKLERSRKEAVEKSPRRQSGVSTAPPTSAEGPRWPIVEIQTGRPSRTRKEPAVDVGTSTTPKSTPKRKRSIGTQAFLPEPKRNKSLGDTPSSLKKPQKTAAKTPDKNVHFASEEEEEEDDSDSSSNIVIQPKSTKKAPPVTPSSPIEISAEETSSSDVSDETAPEPVVAAPSPTKPSPAGKQATKPVGAKVSKAAAAGNQVRKQRVRRTFVEHVDDEEYNRVMEARRKDNAGSAVRAGSTRSGRKFVG